MIITVSNASDLLKKILQFPKLKKKHELLNMAAVCICAYETCQQQPKNFGLGKVKSQNSVIRKNNIHNIYLFWVEDNISIYFLGTGMDRVFLGLAMLLKEVFQGQIPRKIPRSSIASPRKILSIQTLLIGLQSI